MTTAPLCMTRGASIASLPSDSASFDAMPTSEVPTRHDIHADTDRQAADPNPDV
jgi:hypothetical protein